LKKKLAIWENTNVYVIERNLTSKTHEFFPPFIDKPGRCVDTYKLDSSGIEFAPKNYSGVELSIHLNGNSLSIEPNSVLMVKVWYGDQTSDLAEQKTSFPVLSHQFVQAQGEVPIPVPLNKNQNSKGGKFQFHQIFLKNKQTIKQTSQLKKFTNYFSSTISISLYGRIFRS